MVECERGFKVVEPALCEALSIGERIECMQRGPEQALQMARLDAPEKSAELTLSEAQLDISPGPKVIEKDIEMDR